LTIFLVFGAFHFPFICAFKNAVGAEIPGFGAGFGPGEELREELR